MFNPVGVEALFKSVGLLLLYLHSRRYHLAVGGSHPYTHSSLLPPGSRSQSAPRSRGPPSRSHDLQEAPGGKG